MNKVADHHANTCMDEKRSWKWSRTPMPQITLDMNQQIFIDGGRRNDTTASAAWVIYRIKKGAVQTIRHGANFLTNVDSFETDVAAMDFAFLHLQEILAQGRRAALLTWPTMRQSIYLQAR